MYAEELNRPCLCACLWVVFVVQEDARASTDQVLVRAVRNTLPDPSRDDADRHDVQHLPEDLRHVEHRLETAGKTVRNQLTPRDELL